MWRGLREMDLILRDFSHRHLATLSDPDLDLYEALLEEPDPDLLAWITGAAPPPARHAAMVARIRAGAVGVAKAP
jgi:antitoxin CptB